MNTKALISGQAGVAVLLHGRRAQSFHLDGPAGIDRRLEEIPQIFGDCTDVIVVEGIEHEAVSARLELEWAKQRCLSLCLLLLDIESHPESRLLAIPDIEEFLAVPEIANFLRTRLFVAVMPDNADLIGATNRAHNQNAARTAGILEEVSVHQAEIDQCRSAWDALPARTFRDEPSKEGVAFALVQAGAFYQVVTTAAEKRGALLMKLLLQPQFQKWRVGLTTWINSLSLKNRVTNRAVRPIKPTDIPAEARSDVVGTRRDYSLLEAALIGYQHQRELLAAKIAEIQRQLGNAPATASAETPKKRVMNVAARKRIAQAQRKRWAEFHKTQGVLAKKRIMSAEGRERIAEATRKRWAEFRAAKAATAGKPAKKAANRANGKAGAGSFSR